MAGRSILSRLSSNRLPNLCSKLKSANLAFPSILPSKSASSVNHISRISRLPVQLSCLISMMPLHSSVASARLRSLLSIDSHGWSLIPQGISMPL